MLKIRYVDSNSNLMYTDNDYLNDTDTDTTAELQTICKQYWQRLYNLEGDKFDLEHVQKLKAQEVNSKQILPCTQNKKNKTKQKITNMQNKI